MRRRRARRRRSRRRRRAPGQELPDLPDGVRVVEDAREGQGPLQGLLAGLEAVDAELAFAASTDMPFLHPRFVAAVCAAARDADAAVPHLGGFRQPLAAAYRTALTPLVGELVAQGRMKPAFLFERCDTRWLDDLPHPESVRNLNTARTTRPRSPSRSRPSMSAASGRCAGRPRRARGDARRRGRGGRRRAR